jgi:3-hydroxybutyryl-CoA dehydrogenase
MHIAVRATKQQRLEFEQKGFNSIVNIRWLTADENLENVDADVFFDLAFNDLNLSANKFPDKKVVFANAVNATCTDLHRKNYVRINAWEGFLNRPVIEIAGSG